MGFNIEGDEFDIPNLGPHKKGFIDLLNTSDSNKEDDTFEVI